MSPGLSSMFKVRKSTCLRSLYFSISFCRRGNSSRQRLHHSAQKFKNTTLLFNDSRFQVLPVRSASSKAGRGSVEGSQRRVVDCATSFARRPYHAAQPSSVPPRFNQSFLASSASSSFRQDGNFTSASRRTRSAFW